MTLPNFFIIGAQKSGTSSLFRYVKAHPQVFMSRVKEPKFFALNGEGFGFNAPYSLPDEVARVSDLAEYTHLFDEAGAAKAIGEASTWYLHTPGTPERIHACLPQARLVAILRHPIERAYSNFLHNRNYLQIEPLADFEQALHAEEERQEREWGHPWYYKYKGLYGAHLQRYYARFDPQQIRVYLQEDLKADPLALSQDLYRFLEIDEAFTPDFARIYNASRGNVRSRTLHTFLNQPHPLKTALKRVFPQKLGRRVKYRLQLRNRPKPAISPQLRRELIEFFRPDIERLQDLLHRDLSQWLAID